MRQETITVYAFNELPNDRAKEKARDWYRQICLDDEWWDADYEDFRNIFRILGIDAEIVVPLPNGKTVKRLGVYFSGFSSQGDGACFEGRYSYGKGSVKAIREYAAKDKALQEIAADLQEIQRKHFYKIEARLNSTGRYCHEYSVDFDVTVDGSDASDDVTGAVKETMRRLMRWIYRTLEAQYEYLQSDEAVDETLIDGEYEFEANGSPHNRRAA